MKNSELVLFGRKDRQNIFLAALDKTIVYLSISISSIQVQVKSHDFESNRERLAQNDISSFFSYNLQMIYLLIMPS